MKKRRIGYRKRTSWKKGKSGNPKGAPMGWQTWESLYKSALVKTVDSLESQTQRNLSAKELFVINDVLRAVEGDHRSIDRIMDRTEGRAVQRQAIVESDSTLEKIKRESGGDPFKVKQMLQQEFEKRGLFETEITYAVDVPGLEQTSTSTT